MRALYTLLIAGGLNRSQKQEAKTWFKTWWTLVGWPMEYAASLLGTTVNCAELMRAGEAGDEEASAASAALTILREIWEGRAFTAKDVVKAMTIEPKIGGWLAPTNGDEIDKARAEAIADALGELVGRRLDRPTAHSIGKLFQKRLVGRPAWIGDGHIVATLRKSTGHSENTYRVDVSAPGQNPHTPSANTFATADPGRDIPHNPDIPRGGCPNEAGSGNVGKKGNDSSPAASAESAISGRAAPGWSARL